MPDEIQKYDEEYADGIVKQLLRHFDSAQLFLTRLEPDGRTLAFSPGSGNWYTRFGQVQEWLNNGGAMHVSEHDDTDSDDYDD